MQPIKVLVSGASGFVGQALVQRLLAQHPYISVVAASRTQPPWPAHPRLSMCTLPDLSATPARAHDFGQMFEQHAPDVVIHLAARVHVMQETDADPLTRFRQVNRHATEAMARQAAQHGVRRFIYLSSIKVHGESTQPQQPFTAAGVPQPQDAYGLSKWEAEQALHQVAQDTGLEVVVLRPPLVYGPGVKANLAALARLVQTGIPLPLGSITHNRRSLVGVDNLCSLVECCIEHPSAAGQIFLVSDGHDLSTAALCQQLAQAMGRPSRLFGLPQAVLRFLQSAPLAKGIMQRLTGSLQVDITPTCERLHWSPPYSLQHGFERIFSAHETRI